MISTLVFDLGGVLIDWNPEYLYRKIFSRDEDIRHFLSEVCHPDWNAQQDAGQSLDDATEERIEKYPHLEAEIRAYYGRWSEMLGGAIEPTVKILEEYVNNPNYRVYALSNWSHETFPLAKDIFPFLSWFDGLVVSGEEKTKKPEQELYRVLCRRFSINPVEAVFIDDSYPNIVTAKELGFKAIHFKSPHALRSELRELTK